MITKMSITPEQMYWVKEIWNCPASWIYIGHNSSHYPEMMPSSPNLRALLALLSSWVSLSKVTLIFFLNTWWNVVLVFFCRQNIIGFVCLTAGRWWSRTSSFSLVEVVFVTDLFFIYFLLLFIILCCCCCCWRFAADHGLLLLLLFLLFIVVCFCNCWNIDVAVVVADHKKLLLLLKIKITAVPSFSWFLSVLLYLLAHKNCNINFVMTVHENVKEWAKFYKLFLSSSFC